MRVNNSSTACSLLYVLPHQPTLKKPLFRILSWQKANTTGLLSLVAMWQKEYKGLANPTTVSTHENQPWLSS